MRILNNRIDGKTPCGSYTGTLETNVSTLTIVSAGRLTLDSCPEELQAIEATFLNLLLKSKHWHVANDLLVFSSFEGELLHFAKIE